jgi:hypothetical protein
MNAPFQPIKTDSVTSLTHAAIATCLAKFNSGLILSEYARRQWLRIAHWMMILRTTRASFANTAQLAHLVVTFLPQPSDHQ